MGEPTWDATAFDDLCASVASKPFMVALESPATSSDPIFPISGVSCFRRGIYKVTYARVVQVSLLEEGMESLLALLPLLNSREDVRTLFQQDFVDGGTLLKRDLVLICLARQKLVSWVAMMLSSTFPSFVSFLIFELTHSLVVTSLCFVVVEHHALSAVPSCYFHLRTAIPESHGRSDTVDDGKKPSVLVLFLLFNGRSALGKSDAQRESFIMAGIERSSDSKTRKELEGSLKPWMSKWQLFSINHFCTAFRVGDDSWKSKSFKRCAKLLGTCSWRTLHGIQTKTD